MFCISERERERASRASEREVKLVITPVAKASEG